MNEVSKSVSKSISKAQWSVNTKQMFVQLAFELTVANVRANTCANENAL